jgi:NCS1 family nucleobase:cation symporter-1
MRGLIYVKALAFFGAVFGMIGWTVSLAGNSTQTLHQPATVSGSTKSWLICKFFFLGLASCGTFISNAADLQRYSRKPNDPIAGQVISFPLSNFIVAVCGNIIAAASKSIFGEVSIPYVIWYPSIHIPSLLIRIPF